MLRPVIDFHFLETHQIGMFTLDEMGDALEGIPTIRPHTRMDIIRHHREFGPFRFYSGGLIRMHRPRGYLYLSTTFKEFIRLVIP